MNKIQQNLFSLVLEKAEALGWNTYWSGEVRTTGEIEFQKHTPKGEDFSFCVFCDEWNTGYDLHLKIQEYADDFDPEEHAANWYNIRDEVSGVPRSLEGLLYDAKAILGMVEKLASAVSEIPPHYAIRCNNCMAVFDTAEDLSKILEIQNEHSTIDRMIYDPCADLPSTEDALGEERHFEVFNGCPNCFSDEYLMDMEEDT